MVEAVDQPVPKAKTASLSKSQRAIMHWLPTESGDSQSCRTPMRGVMSKTHTKVKGFVVWYFNTTWGFGACVSAKTRFFLSFR